jgi:hypothetical protein
MVAATKWLIRILMVVALLAVAFSAVYNAYRGYSLTTIALVLCLVVNVLNARSYFKREAASLQNIVGEPHAKASRTRLSIFWAVAMVTPLITLLVLTHPRP